jgi:hypothetical protein
MDGEVWFTPLVWTDYRLAFILTVIVPVVLLFWSLANKIDAIVRLLIIYWRVASLLLISIYLLIPGWQIGYAANFLVRVLIPISLWFWVDLNDEIKDLPHSSLKLALNSWRWAVTIYSSIGAIATIPFLSCAFTSGAVEAPFCEVWLQATWRYKSLFHPDTNVGVLGFFGTVGLAIYGLYFAYFLFIRLGKQGRIALEQ